MSDAMQQFQQVFFEEASEHLEAMERLLLAIDVATPDADDLDAIFRAAHSIKGGAGVFGLHDLIEVTHILETLLDKIRKHVLPLQAEMIDVFLAAGDVLRDQLGAHQGGSPVSPERIADNIGRLQQFSLQPQPIAAEPAPQTTPKPPAPAPTTFRHAVRLHTPAQNAERIQMLADELANLGECAVSAEGDSTVFVLTTVVDASIVRDIFEFVASEGEYAIDTQPLPPASNDEASDEDGFGFFVTLTPPVAAEPVEDEDFGFFEPLPAAPPAAPTQNAAGDTLEEDGFGFFAPLPNAATPAEPPPAPAAPKAGSAAATALRKGTASGDASADSSIRVSVEKVDQMINLVGELVITQAMLLDSVARLDAETGEQLQHGMVQLERNTRDLQEAVMSIRMMPISFVFGRFPRLVRDLAAKLGKEIELITEGEATELDKGLIEKIVDPLTHLVRNSLDHGIESPTEREAAGKPRKGLLVLRAGHKGGSIIIEVQDNGRGLNRERILAKAAERGMAVDATMSDAEVWQLIFAPGFSTAEAVTDVSGRGVGMDVVKRNIDALGGRVELASLPGVGTTIVIQLPLTLAILDGMSVAVGDQTFIIPLAHIIESMQPRPDALRSLSAGTGSGQMIQVRGEYLPIVPIWRVFNLDPETTDPTQGIVVIVETGSGRQAFLVDSLLGQHQVVIKRLDANYRKVGGIAGATIMGDGRVALIIDTAGVARLALS